MDLLLFIVQGPVRVRMVVEGCEISIELLLQFLQSLACLNVLM